MRYEVTAQTGAVPRDVLAEQGLVMAARIETSSHGSRDGRQRAHAVDMMSPVQMVGSQRFGRTLPKS